MINAEINLKSGHLCGTWDPLCLSPFPSVCLSISLPFLFYFLLLPLPDTRFLFVKQVTKDNHCASV